MCSLTIPSTMISKMCDTITKTEYKIIRLYRLSFSLNFFLSLFDFDFFFFFICYLLACAICYVPPIWTPVLLYHVLLARSIYMCFSSSSLLHSFAHTQRHTLSDSQVLSISIEYKCTFRLFSSNNGLRLRWSQQRNNTQRARKRAGIKMRVDEFSMSLVFISIYLYVRMDVCLACVMCVSVCYF